MHSAMFSHLIRQQRRRPTLGSVVTYVPSRSASSASHPLAASSQRRIVRALGCASNHVRWCAALSHSAGRGAAMATAAGLVQLNVGGVRYVTSRMTLLGGGGASFFSGLVGDTGDALRGAGSFSPAAAQPSGRRRKRVASDGDGEEDDEATEPLFIDRNGALFAPILEFLRCGRRNGPPCCALRSRRRAARAAPPLTIALSRSSRQRRSCVAAVLAHA